MKQFPLCQIDAKIKKHLLHFKHNFAAILRPPVLTSKVNTRKPHMHTYVRKQRFQKEGFLAAFSKALWFWLLAYLFFLTTNSSQMLQTSGDLLPANMSHKDQVN